MNLVAEATSDYNDGFVKAAAKRKLKVINEYVANTVVVKKETRNTNAKSDQLVYSQK
jgi:hypothetical protein